MQQGKQGPRKREQRFGQGEWRMWERRHGWQRPWQMFQLWRDGTPSSLSSSLFVLKSHLCIAFTSLFQSSCHLLRFFPRRMTPGPCAYQEAQRVPDCHSHPPSRQLLSLREYVESFSASCPRSAFSLLSQSGPTPLLHSPPASLAVASRVVPFKIDRHSRQRVL